MEKVHSAEKSGPIVLNKRKTLATVRVVFPKTLAKNSFAIMILQKFSSRTFDYLGVIRIQ